MGGRNLDAARFYSLTNAYALGLDPNALEGIKSSLRRCMIPTPIVWGMADIFFSQESLCYIHSGR
jgi:haloalkane dehalogenase